MENNDILSYRLAMECMDQLVESGVTSVVVSPGFRNSPLLLAAQKHPSMKVYTSVDERSGAFLALGLSRRGMPAAVLCTSGTAVANFYPAVMEAYTSHCGLILITADRPQELVGSGANQCTDQSKVFGSHVRFQGEIAVPDSEESTVQARYLVGRAVIAALEPVPGPVHVNVRFREPFLPTAEGVEKFHSTWSRPKTGWKFLASSSGPSKEQWDAIHSVFSTAERPLLVVGPGLSQPELDGLFAVAETNGYPILAESASGLPFRSSRSNGISRHMETLLAWMVSGKILPPDLVVRFGPPTTGKALGRLLKKFPLPQLVFDEWSESREPHLYPSICVQGGKLGWLSALARSELRLKNLDWGREILGCSDEIDKELGLRLSDAPWTEWTFHHLLSEKIGDHCALFLGNSMPIRDFNAVFHSRGKRFDLYTNRGLSGIDGLIATAAGVALSIAKETHLILGDLSTLHDLSSLALLSPLRDELNFTVWVMNNGGGEIFKIVQTSKTSGPKEWFTTPQSFDLSSIAKGFGLSFTRVANRKDWEQLDDGFCRGRGVRVIEVIPDAAANMPIRSILKELE